MSLRGLLICLLLASVCWSEPGSAEVEPLKGGLVVVAPHPDDEALMAGGAIAGAVARGEPVAVLVLTSGDFDCRSAASTRQAESVAALAALGVREDQIFFLGYPDGYLSRLGVAPLPAVPRLIDGVCVRGNTTYGQRGAGRADVHTARAGAPAEYTAPNLVADLRYLLERLAPRRLIVTHPADTHPDHAAAYAFVRRALAGSHRPPRLLRALVHGDDCWPTSSKPGPDCAPGRIAPSEAMPLPSGVLRGYLPNLRLAVPSSCLRPEADKNPKLAAIAAYTSQTRGSSSSYLFAFARREELFFTEDLPTRIEPRVDNELRFSMRGHERFRVEQRVPLDLSVTLERPAPGKPMRVSLLDTGNERYVLDFDGAALQVSLSIQSGGGLIALKQWPLPHDAWATAERFELQVARDPADASAAALTLLRNDVIVGVAIDPDPPSRGGSVSVVDPSGSREGVRLSLTRR